MGLPQQHTLLKLVAVGDRARGICRRLNPLLEKHYYYIFSLCLLHSIMCTSTVAFFSLKQTVELNVLLLL